MTATLYPSTRTGRPHHVGSPAVAHYGLRRAVAVVLVVMVAALLAVAVTSIAGALVDVGGRPAAASDIVSGGVASPIVRVHVAEPGDTLWSIADRYRGDVGRGRFVDALVDLNGGAGIQIGQAVRLP
jgi:Tfp pilus assembly protein FimV